METNEEEILETKLDQFYELRTDFSVIGITGRTGSGCSDIATVLSKKFSEIKNLRSHEDFEPSVFKKKYEIVYDFTKQNWKTYKIIEYKKVLLLLLLPALYNKADNSQLFDFFRYKLKKETDSQIIDDLKSKIRKQIISENQLVSEIISLGKLSEIKDEKAFKSLAEIFWGDRFNKLADSINKELSNAGFIERIMLLLGILMSF